MTYRELGRTRAGTLRAPATTSEHTAIDPKARKCPTWASANRPRAITGTSNRTVSLVK
jgi:hypothetical protein